MDWLISGIAVPFALSTVALLGYLVGLKRRSATAMTGEQMAAVQRKMRRADELIRRIETVSKHLRRHLAVHHANVHHCRERIEHLTEQTTMIDGPASPSPLSEMLGPADQLTREIAAAYDELRQHSRALAELRNW